MAAPAKAIGDALLERKKKVSSVTYRVKCLDTTINNINRALRENSDPRGSVITNLVERMKTESEAIGEEMKKFSDLNVEINVAASEIQDTEQDGNNDPTQFKEDVEHILAMCEFKFMELDNSVAQRMHAIDMVKATIATKIAQLQMISLPNSRNSSPGRTIKPT